MKRYARVLDGTVSEVIEIVDEVDIADLTPEGYVWIPAAAEVRDGWLYQHGKLVPPATTPVDSAAAMAGKWPLVQAFMDAKAVELGFQNLADAVSYAEEPAVLQFQEAGRALRAWRSLVRARFDEILAEVEAGERDIPSDDELISELPALEIPQGE